LAEAEQTNHTSKCMSVSYFCTENLQAWKSPFAMQENVQGSKLMSAQLTVYIKVWQFCWYSKNEIFARHVGSLHEPQEI